MTKEQLISTIQKRRFDLVALRKSYRGVLLGAGHIVRNEGVHYCVETEGNKVVDVQTCPVERATMFVKSDAENLAASISNGRGETGEAVHIVDAIEDEIKEVDQVLADLADQVLADPKA